MKIVITENAEKSYFDITNKYSETKAALFSKNTVSILDMIQHNNHIGSKYKKTFYTIYRKRHTQIELMFPQRQSKRKSE